MNSIDRRRNDAAQTAFENHEFSSSDVPESADGWTWTTPGNEWERVLYFPNLEDPEGPTVAGRFVVTFRPDTAVIDQAYATINGNDVGRRPSPEPRDDWVHADGMGWWKKLPAWYLSHALQGETPSLTIIEKNGVFWLHDADQPGELDFTSLQAAKDAGDTIAAVRWDQYSDNMARDAGLDRDQWTFHQSENRSWFEHVDAPTTIIEFRRSGWAAIRDGEEFPEQSTAKEAGALLEEPPALKRG